MQVDANILAVIVLGYLLGSVPFGLVLTRLTGAGDLRAIGSGNIGATNVLRTGRKGLAAATLLLDLAKGFAAVWLGRILWPELELGSVAAMAAVVGHCFPIWLKFKGGKGVATMLGVSLGLDWRIGLASAAVWLIVARLTRISSVGGMSAAVAAPLAALVIYKTSDPNLFRLGETFAYVDYAVALAAIALLVIVLHRANIGRLIAGTEPRIGGKAKANAPE